MATKYRNYESRGKYEEDLIAAREELASHRDRHSSIPLVLKHFDEACEKGSELDSLQDQNIVIDMACVCSAFKTLKFMFKAFDIKPQSEHITSAINGEKIEVLVYLHENGAPLLKKHANRAVDLDYFEGFMFLVNKKCEMDYQELVERCVCYASVKCFKPVIALAHLNSWDDTKYLPLFANNYHYFVFKRKTNMVDRYEKFIRLLSKTFGGDYQEKVDAIGWDNKIKFIHKD